MISYLLGIFKKFKKARDNFEFYKNLRINRSILKKLRSKYILKSLYQRIINFL
ncbi:hypothetical protein LEP1GSC024_2643 [Leptospira noguchii str. 2001034031]|uniref:Uncharacterized protein n=1 Tax=Leptospira noguchii str. 2001034031 TaxID=1193053 RepID=M6YCS8_9LEPT|nr:hypothetical protein LEP1GSC024_2643 [Leptospira noguchii str. 2001034031]